MEYPILSADVVWNISNDKLSAWDVVTFEILEMIIKQHDCRL
jgi:hypothetical protein